MAPLMKSLGGSSSTSAAKATVSVSRVPTIPCDRRRRPSQDTDTTKNTLSSEDLISTMSAAAMTELARTGTPDLPGDEQNGPAPSTATATPTSVADADAPPQQPQPQASKSLARRWKPKRGGRAKPSAAARSLTRSLKSGVLRSFSLSNHPYDLSDLGDTASSHPMKERSSETLRHSGTHTDLAKLLHDLDGDSQFEAALLEKGASEGAPHDGSSVPRRASDGQRRPLRRPSMASSGGGSMSTTDLDDNDLDVQASHLDSGTMLTLLGANPSPRDLANVAAVRANEYIHECLFGDEQSESVLSKEKWESIPQFSKSELIVRKHLGKGSFSDAFEVTTLVEAERAPSVKDLRASERRLASSCMSDEVAVGLDAEDGDNDILDDFGGSDLSREIDALFGTQVLEEDEDDLDKEVDALFGSAPSSSNGGAPLPMTKLTTVVSGEVAFPPASSVASIGDQPAHANGKRTLVKLQSDLGVSRLETALPGINQDWGSQDFVPEMIPNARRQRRPRRQTIDAGVSVSFCVSTKTSRRKRPVTYAMKCLRPQIRSNAEQFMVGVEDLVHETAMLASLDHPNIIQLHGRAGGGCVSSSFRLSDGYFILLDRLTDTLDDRIARWRTTNAGSKGKAPALNQLRTARSIADALAYLHSKNIAFRDLKPQNVGFDSAGVLKLFDFGFAIGLPVDDAADGSEDGEESTQFLYDRCGTPRYMAPEVDLGHGYGTPADVHSYGILLWEICALKRPFSNVKTAGEFTKAVFEEGARPKLSKYWPQMLNDLMSGCWSSYPGDRPTMEFVKTMLDAHVREASALQNDPRLNGEASMRKSWVMRRLTG